MGRHLGRYLLVCAVVAADAFAFGSQQEAIPLPGESDTKPAISPAPFPDRMSAYVWRNWFVVPHGRLAETVGAEEGDLEEIAAQMGLPRKVDVSSEWQRKGYITVIRRNWHLLDYPQLLQVLDMSREELRFSLVEDDFLFVKLGNVKPKCGELRWDGGEVEKWRGARERIAQILKEEGADDFTEEPRFQFVQDLSQTSQTPQTSQTSPFDFRLIFSYFADYKDPLWDDEIGSYPEGLLQKLAAQGVNAVWLHTVLRTLAKDPAYPEFGDGSERRIDNLNTLVKRCAKYGIRVFLYLNEPRAMPDEFFRGKSEREAFRGCPSDDGSAFAMCTSSSEVRRWVRDSVEQVFRGVPGLGGIFTITMSENLTNCASHGNRSACPRCKDRSSSEIVAEINTAMIEGMQAADSDAEALLYDWQWSWTDGGCAKVIAGLPRQNVRILSVSESRIPVERGGVPVTVDDYSISVVGPGNAARGTWSTAKAAGLPTAAKIQSNCSWELAAFPYLPVMDLVAEHALNLVREDVDGVMLSWTLGCCPAPNLSVFRDVRKDDADKGEVLERIAVGLYGAEAAPAVRASWSAFADGYREYPFSCNVAYYGPQHMGPANPLYHKPTGYSATMVGIPYDAVKNWCAEYPASVWSNQMAMVRDGFERGCALFETAIPLMPEERRAAAERELRLFRAETLHFRSCVDQVGFYLARDAKDGAAMKAAAARELATAKEMLTLARGDSRFGFESSCQYFYVPQDLREKILSCRAEAASEDIPGQLNFPAAEVADEQGRYDLASPGAWGGDVPGASTDVRVAGGGSRTVTASRDVEFGLLINGLDTWKSNRLTFDMTGYEPPRKLKFTGFRSGETSSSFLHTTFRGGIWDFGGGSFGSYYGNYYGDYHDLVVSDAAVITNVASICLGYMAQKGLSAELLGNSRVFVDGVFQFGNNKDGASDPNILKVCDGSLLDLGQLAWDGQSVAEWHPEYTHDAYRATVLVSNATLVSRASTTCVGRRGQDLLHVTRNGLFKALKNVTAFDNLSRCSKIRVEDGGEIAIGTSFYGGGGASDHEGLNDNRVEILENGKLSVGWYFHLGYGCNYGNTLVVSNGTYIGAFYWGGRNGTIRLQGPNVKFDSGENTGLFDDQPNCTFEISDGCTYVPKVTLWSCGGIMTSNCTLRISRNGTLAKSLTVERNTSLSLTTPSTVVDNRIIVEEGGSISGDFLDVIGVRTRLRLSDSTITLRSTAISLAVGWNTTAYGGLSSDCTFTLAGTHPAVKTSGMMAVMGGSKVVFELPEDGYDAGCIPLDLAGGIRAWGEGGKLVFANAEAMRERHLKDGNDTRYVLVRIPVGKDFIPDDVIAEAQASLGDGFRLAKTVEGGYAKLELSICGKGLFVLVR